MIAAERAGNGAEEPQPEGPKPASEVPATSPSMPTVPAAHDADLVETELLIEEISIDGMCGVY